MQLKWKKWYGLVLLTILSFNLKAQLTQTIRGTIIDNILQIPIESASVLLVGTNQSVITDNTGKFKFTNVVVGLHTVRVTHISFKDGVAANIVVNSGKEVVLNIGLEGNIKVQNEVVVKADSRKNRPINDMSVVSARAFTVEETQKYAVAVNDPLRMVTNYAGVVSADDGNNNIVIRGNSPAGLLWRMEGIDIPNPNHFASAGSSGGGISILSSQLLANSDFITGAFASEYGNAVSGVFDLRLRKGNNEKREYTLQAGLLGLNAAAEGPLNLFGKGSYLVNYRYSTLQLLDKIGVGIGVGATNFQDLSYNIHIPTPKAGTFTFFGFGGLSSQNSKPLLDSLKWKEEGDRYSAAFKGNTGMSAITHSILLGSRTTLKSAIGYSVAENGVDVNYAEQNYSISKAYLEKYITKKWTFSSTVNRKFSNRSVLRAGVFVNQIDYNYLQRSKENPNAVLKEVINVKGQTQTIQAFTQWQLKPADKLMINIGLHYLQLLLNNTNSIEPRASVKWELNKKNSISFGYGLHSQLQGLGVYFAQTKDAAGRTAMPNKNLGFTKSHHYVLSHSYLLGKNLKLKTELYYQQLFNVPVSVSDTNTFSTLNIQGDYVTDALVNKGKGRNYGLELSLEKYLSNNFYYMWSNSLYQSKYTASDRVERNTRYNGGYVTNFIAGKDFVTRGGRRTFGLNIRLVYAGGFRTTPINLERSRQERYTIFYDKDAFSLQNPAYFRTDTRLSIKWNKKRMTSTLSLDIQNITNRLNLFSRYYDPQRGRIVDELQTGLIPILNYKIDF
jgi:Carboxypeptidase regulatory-like domain